MNRFKLCVLQAIAWGGGKYSWYQIDRYVSTRGFGPEALKNLMSTLADSIRLNYITEFEGHHPAHPVYQITQLGAGKISTSTQILSELSEDDEEQRLLNADDTIDTTDINKNKR